MNSTIFLLNVQRTKRLPDEPGHSSVLSIGLMWFFLMLFLSGAPLLSAQQTPFVRIHAENLDWPFQNHPASAGFQSCHLLHLSFSRQPPASFSVSSATDYLHIPSFYPDKTRLPWAEECLPFFCRVERQWGKRRALPVKFRLGSVDYVDWLEGKARFSNFGP